MLTDRDILDLFRETVGLVLVVSLPVVIAAAVIGVLVSLLQALTQVQEQTLPFAFKLVAVAVALFVTYESTVAQFHYFTLKIFDAIQQAATSTPAV